MSANTSPSGVSASWVAANVSAGGLTQEQVDARVTALTATDLATASAKALALGYAQASLGTSAVLAETIFAVSPGARPITHIRLVCAAAWALNSTVYGTITVRLRPASAPGTPVTLATFSNQALGFSAWATVSTAVAQALAAGDVLTVQVAKTGGNQTIPAFHLHATVL